MHLRPEQADEADYQLDEIIETESPEKERDIPRVDPIRNKDIVVRQQGLDGAAQQGREVARERSNDQDDRLVSRPILTEMEQVAKRIGGDDLFGTAIASPSIVTARMPKSGRLCDMPALDSSSIAAAALRIHGAFPTSGHGWLRKPRNASAISRIGPSTSLCT